MFFFQAKNADLGSNLTRSFYATSSDNSALNSDASIEVTYDKERRLVKGHFNFDDRRPEAATMTNSRGNATSADRDDSAFLSVRSNAKSRAKPTMRRRNSTTTSRDFNKTATLLYDGRTAADISKAAQVLLHSKNLKTPLDELCNFSTAIYK